MTGPTDDPTNDLSDPDTETALRCDPYATAAADALATTLFDVADAAADVTSAAGNTAGYAAARQLTAAARRFTDGDGRVAVVAAASLNFADQLDASGNTLRPPVSVVAPLACLAEINRTASDTLADVAAVTSGRPGVPASRDALAELACVAATAVAVFAGYAAATIRQCVDQDHRKLAAHADQLNPFAPNRETLR